MSADKILEKWRIQVPPQVLLRDVLLVAKSKFESVTPPKGGGHYKIFDNRMLRLWRLRPDFISDCPNGTYGIATVNGRFVKGYYVERMIELIDIVDEMTEKGY